MMHQIQNNHPLNYRFQVCHKILFNFWEVIRVWVTSIVRLSQRFDTVFPIILEPTNVTHLCGINISQLLNAVLWSLLVNNFIVIKSSVNVPIPKDLMTLLIKIKSFKDIFKLVSYFLLYLITCIEVGKFNLNGTVVCV